eukprot:Ihof_evm13s43 gene=Ihof_evmTU13s43
MGCASSTSTGQKAEQERNKVIEAELEKEKKQQACEIKLLLLGAGESGKSTIVKQMKIIHENGYSNDERQPFREVIYGNTIQSMQELIRAHKRLDIPLANPELESSIDVLMALEEVHDLVGLPPQVANSVRDLWADDGIQACYKRRNEFQLNDSAAFYFDAIDRITDDGYVPTEQDILYSRVKTTGIVETQFYYKDMHFRMFDVGGQRSERKKWIHCFDTVTAIIFCVALSAFDLVLLEDEETNRMHESLILFDYICNSEWFLKTSIILFLNKTDLFALKIAQQSLTCCFPEYT